ncbi:MAG: type IV pilus modification protein PilV [Candidatus Rokuibacteriota bacterium]
MQRSLTRSSAAGRSGPRRSRGSVLIEGLIAILVFSVGVLAIVRLQAAAIHNTQDAKLRTDASFVAGQIISQMWADRGTNSVNLPCYAYPTAGVCPSAASTAARDAWIASFTTPGGSNYLPGATAAQQAITVDANARVTVIIRWQMPGDPSVRSFSTAAQIRG